MADLPIKNRLEKNVLLRALESIARQSRERTEQCMKDAMEDFALMELGTAEVCDRLYERLYNLDMASPKEDAADG